MLGKRPRPLQRINSKSQLMPEGSSSIAHKPCTPVLGVPRQVIGFNPVCKDDDTGGGSPRSVLEAKSISGVGSANLQEKQARSPRSPRSGLESLLSTPRPWEKRGSEGVGLGIVAALHTSEGDASKARAVVEVAKGVMANSVAASAHGMLANAFQQPQLHSPKQSQPIPINQVVQSSPRGCNGLHCSRHVVGDEIDNSPTDSISWKGLGGLSNHKHGKSSGRGAITDMELDSRASIFSTASPASSCNENTCLLPAIDFLNACYFCKRRLGPGKDIYMYRGDRAFCSVECRYQQIVIDERKERCPALSMKASTPFPSAAHNHRGRVIAAAAN